MEGAHFSVGATLSLQPCLNNIFNSVADLVNRLIDMEGAHFSVGATLSLQAWFIDWLAVCHFRLTD
jgi:hypothetical protein